MRRLSTWLATIIEAFEGQRVPRSDRPTSLYEAGRVGSLSGERLTRSKGMPDAWFESGAEPTAEERTSRRERPATGRRSTVVSRPMSTAVTARRLRSTLRNPDSLLTAILLGEVLGPPVSRSLRKR